MGHDVCASALEGEAAGLALSVSAIARGLADYRPLSGALCGSPVSGEAAIACMFEDMIAQDGGGGGSDGLSIFFGDVSAQGDIPVVKVISPVDGTVAVVAPGTLAPASTEVLGDDVRRVVADAWERALASVWVRRQARPVKEGVR